MLTCIACTKQLGGQLRPPEDDDGDDEEFPGGGTPSTRQAIKALTAQIKEMAMKASGAYRHCKPCSGPAGAERRRRLHHDAAYADSEASERLCPSYPRAVRSGDATPASASGRTEGAASSVFVVEEDEEPREWVAQVEPGVLITFLALPAGGNDLKRIRFSREIFTKWQAQRWWAENYDKVMELYNVQHFNHQTVPLPTPLRSEDESSKIESTEASPLTPPLGKEWLPRDCHQPLNGVGMGYSSSDSFGQRYNHLNHGHHNVGRHYYDSGGLTSTPKLSSISGAKTETSSMDASLRTSSSHEEEGMGSEVSVSVSNTSDQETEWVEQDEPGVYITVRSLPGGIRELRRVRFSRERFGEMHARLWWDQNRGRIHQQYL